MEEDHLAVGSRGGSFGGGRGGAFGGSRGGMGGSSGGFGSLAPVETEAEAVQVW